MSAISVTVCFRELFCDVCQCFSLVPPIYDIPVENKQGLVSVMLISSFVGEILLRNLLGVGVYCVMILIGLKKMSPVELLENFMMSWSSK